MNSKQYLINAMKNVKFRAGQTLPRGSKHTLFSIDRVCQNLMAATILKVLQIVAFLPCLLINVIEKKCFKHSCKAFRRYIQK